MNKGWKFCCVFHTCLQTPCHVILLDCRRHLTHMTRKCVFRENGDRIAFNYCNKVKNMVAIEHFDRGKEPKHYGTMKRWWKTLIFISVFLPLFCLSFTSLNVANFSVLIHTFFLLVKYLSSSCHGSWLERSRATLLNCSLSVKEMLKAKNAIQALLPTLRDDACVSAYVLLSVSHIFFLLFPSLSKFKPLFSPTSTSAYRLYSIFMSVSHRKTQPLAVNWPISHISFLKVKTGRDVCMYVCVCVHW